MAHAPRPIQRRIDQTEGLANNVARNILTISVPSGGRAIGDWFATFEAGDAAPEGVVLHARGNYRIVNALTGGLQGSWEVERVSPATASSGSIALVAMSLAFASPLATLSVHFNVTGITPTELAAYVRLEQGGTPRDVQFVSS